MNKSKKIEEAVVEDDILGITDEELSAHVLDAIDAEEVDDQYSGVEPVEPLDKASTESSSAVPNGEIESPTTEAVVETKSEPQAPVEEQPAVAPIVDATVKPEDVKPVEASKVEEAKDTSTSSSDLLSKVKDEIGKSRDVFVKTLAESVYQMDEDEATEALTDPQKVLPMLAARVHVEAVQHVLGALAQILPTVVGGVLQAKQEHSQVMDEFFTKWPTLDRTSDLGTVLELARVYRAQYPNASKDELVQKVGAMAVVQLGKLPTIQTAQAKVPASPYQPVGRAPVVQQPSSAPNPWDEVAELLME